MDSFFVFFCFAFSEMNCTYLFIYHAVKWNQHHILVMIGVFGGGAGGGTRVNEIKTFWNDFNTAHSFNGLS